MNKEDLSKETIQQSKPNRSDSKSRNRIKNATKNMAYIAVFVALMAVCAWIAIPMPSGVSITLQVFAVFCALGFLDGRRGTIAIVCYLLLGLVGAPVFSNFNGGLGAFTMLSSGYLVGFVFTGLFYWIFTKILGNKIWVMAIAMVIGLIICYAFGTMWFVFLYGKQIQRIALGEALMLCVVPYIPFDIAKIVLALVLTKTLAKKIIKI